MLEKTIETRLKREIEKLGGMCLKFTSPGTPGVPDRIVIFSGKIYFAELKRPGGKLRPLQEVVQQKLKSHGAKIYTIDSYESIKEFCNRIKKEV